MGGRNGQELLSTWVPSELAEQFRAWARARDGGASAALRGLVAQAVTGEAPAAPRGTGAGHRLTVRLRDDERDALLAVSQARGVTPATWVRALAVAHLLRRPQWNPAEVEALRDLFGEVRRIGNNVNQIAYVLNVAAQNAEYPPYQGEAAREATELLRAEMRRIVAVMTGNFDYWGLPDAGRPTAAPGAVERDDEASRREREKVARRPRRRPARFRDGKNRPTAAEVGDMAAAQPGQAGPELSSGTLSPVGERVVARTIRQALASMPPQTPEQVTGLERHARDLVLRREQAGEVFADPGEA